MLITSSTAYAHASVVIDPEGDISASTPPHYDILKAKVHATGDETEDHKSIVFSMKLAAPIPALECTTFYGANWLLDTDSTRVGREYNVIVRWCTTITHPRCHLCVAHCTVALKNFASGSARQDHGGRV